MGGTKYARLVGGTKYAKYARLPFVASRHFRLVEPKYGLGWVSQPSQTVFLRRETTPLLETAYTKPPEWRFRLPRKES